MENKTPLLDDRRTLAGGTSGAIQNPILGDKWQAGSKGQSIPKSSKNPRFVIPQNCLDDHRKNMRDHEFICKFSEEGTRKMDTTNLATKRGS